MALVELGWAWVRYTDGAKLAGGGFIGRGPFLWLDYPTVGGSSYGRYTIQPTAGTLVAAQVTNLSLTSLSTAHFQVAIIGGAAEVQILDGANGKTEADFLIRLYGVQP
jgi:hypothetical protein